MTIRLYHSAWVRIRDADQPQQVFKNRSNPAIFEIGGFLYDIDGRPYSPAETIPEIVEILNIQAARDLGVSTHYTAPKDIQI